MKNNDDTDFAQAIVDTIREPILILDERLIVQSANLPFLRMFKVSEEETIGSLLFMLGNNQWDIPELKRILLEVLPQKSILRDFEIEHVFPRIGKKFISLNARQLTLPRSERKLILLTMEDVTMMNRVKESNQNKFDNLEVKKSESDATVLRLEDERALREKFVSTLSHDLRNPLTAARMAAQMVMRNITSVENISKLTLRIITSLDRVDHMITDLLDANMIQAGEGVRLNIDKCDASHILNLTIEDMISVYGDRFKITAPETLSIESDSQGFRRIIENLISNAIKYGDPLTKVEITLKNSGPEWLEFKVRNFGTIIKSQDLEMIFHQFGRTNSARKSSNVGWGLGLTLVMGISRGLGGDVSVTSDEKNGTSFMVKLPIRTGRSKDLDQFYRS